MRLEHSIRWLTGAVADRLGTVVVVGDESNGIDPPGRLLRRRQVHLRILGDRAEGLRRLALRNYVLPPGNGMLVRGWHIQ